MALYSALSDPMNRQAPQFNIPQSINVGGQSIPNYTPYANYSPMPSFPGILSGINKPINLNPVRDIGGSQTFQQGIESARPQQGLTPELQQTLDIIRQNQQYAASQGISQAQALASRRGLAGSSIEQFGTQQAGEAASRSAQEQVANVLLANAQRQQQLQDLSSKAYFDRASQEATLGAQLAEKEGDIQFQQAIESGRLSSDEIASLRNMDYANRQLAIQTILGQRGLDIQEQNIGVSKDIAGAEQRNALLQTGAGLFAPYLLPKVFGTGPGGYPLPSQAGGVAPGTFGGDGTFNPGGGGVFNPGYSQIAQAGAGGGAATYGGVGTGQFVPGVGQVGTGVGQAGLFGPGGSLLNTAGTGSFGAGSILPGLAGYEAARLISPASQSGDQGAMNVGAGIGGFAGSFFGPVGTGVGSALGSLYGKASNRLVKGTKKALGETASEVVKYANPVTAIASVGNKVSKTVKSIFPF